MGKIDTLIRDITKVGWMSKSEARRRIEDLLEEQKKDDNVIYLFLIPDVNKRIAPGINYFDAPIESFQLSSDEETAIT